MTDFDREVAELGLAQAEENLLRAEACGLAGLAEWERDQVARFKKMLGIKDQMSLFDVPPPVETSGARAAVNE